MNRTAATALHPTTRPATAFAGLDLAGLAARIADHGIEAIGTDGGVESIVRAARCINASATLIAVLGDPGAPPVARERAFGRLAVHLATHRPADDAAPSLGEGSRAAA